MKFSHKILPGLILVFTYLFFCNSVRSQMRAIHLDSTNGDTELKKIEFLSPKEGWVATYSWIGYTSDSGRTFLRKMIRFGNVDYNGYSPNLTLGFSISGIKAFDKDNLLVYGSYFLVPAILKSADGGNTFKLVFYSFVDPNEYTLGVADMVFPENGNIGYAVDTDRILKTINKGATWVPIKNTPRSYYDHIETAGNNVVVAFSNLNSTTYFEKTNDGGLNWIQVPLPVKARIGYVHFLNEQTGWISLLFDDSKELFYKTQNGGVTWVKLNDEVANPILFMDRLKFFDENIGYGLVAQNKVYKTTNGGVVWEQLPRDNDFSYLGYTHKDLQVLHDTYIWASGGHGFLELNSNAAVKPLPAAYFKIDTSNILVTNSVKLVNFSAKDHQHKWYLNGSLIGSQYQVSYTRDLTRRRDTITLIVSNGVLQDTLTRYQEFFLPPTIRSFSPREGDTGDEIEIIGTGLSSVTAVRFGGVPAKRYSVFSDNKIVAIVSDGSTGDITLETLGGSARISGFMYIGEANTSIPYYISDSILCKSEPIYLEIPDAEAGVTYAFYDQYYNKFGEATADGRPLRFATIPISKSGEYSLRGTRAGSIHQSVFNKTVNIHVEHTRSAFAADAVNVEAGVMVNYRALSQESDSYRWTFHGDASVSSSTSNNPGNISYSTVGVKALTLISTSANGCVDTITAPCVTVYKRPVVNPICYTQAVADSFVSNSYDYYTGIFKPTLTKDNGFLLSGFGRDIILNTTSGSAKPLGDKVVAYVAKYTDAGVLSWYCSLQITEGASFQMDNEYQGRFFNTGVDREGNIYILGRQKIHKTLSLPNGEIIKVSDPHSHDEFSTQTNGFILKLDKNGKYLWHAILDHESIDAGYLNAPKHLSVSESGIVISGSVLRDLTYVSPQGKRTTVVKDLKSFNDDDDYLIKINAEGDLIWHRYITSSAENWQLDSVSDVVTDSNDNCYVSGRFLGSLVVYDVNGKKELQTQHIGAYYRHGAYLLKLDKSGKMLWARDMSSVEYHDTWLLSIDVDKGENCYVTGSSTKGVVSNLLKDNNTVQKTDTLNLDGFSLLKFDKSGNFLWSVGSSNSETYAPHSIVNFHKDKLYVMARVGFGIEDTSTLIIKSSDHSELNVPVNKPETFMVVYDTDGLLQQVVGGGGSYEASIIPQGLIVQDDRFIMTGVTGHTIGIEEYRNFGTKFDVTDLNDAFVSIIDPEFCSTDKNKPAANAGRDTTVCKNSLVQLGLPAIEGYVYSWVNKKKHISGSAMPTVPVSETSTYYLTVTNSSGLVSRDSVIVTVQNGSISGVGKDSTICKGSSIVIGSDPVANNTYGWRSAGGDFSSSVSNPTVSPTADNSYYLTVEHSSGCIIRDTFNVKVQDVPELPLLAITGEQKVFEGEASTVSLGLGSFDGRYSLIWQDSTKSHSWQSISGSKDSLAIKHTPQSTGDGLRAMFTSNHPCLRGATAVSNTILFTVEIKKDTTGTNNPGGENPGNPDNPGNPGNPDNPDNPDSTDNPVRNIYLYPNPVMGWLTIGNLSRTDFWYDITVKDMAGRPVMTLRNNFSGVEKMKINVTNLLPGYYTITLHRIDGATKRLRFLKI